METESGKTINWQIHELFESNIEKIRQNYNCWYCRQKMTLEKLTRNHVFPRITGGKDRLDNIIIVYKTYLSSKDIMDSKDLPYK